MNDETGDPPVAPILPDEPVKQEDRVQDQTVGETFARLIADAQAYATAEADRQKLRAGIFAAGIRDAAVLALVAVMLLFGTIVALLIGLIIALSPKLTPLGATGAVLGSALGVSFALLLLAKARITRIKKATRG